jgi:ribosomal protein S7
MSPYGVDKKQGGDNKSNDAWMEKCVSSVMKSGKSKGSAIAICKTQLSRKKESKSELEEIKVDQDIIGREEVQRHQFIGKAMADGMTFEQAKSQYEATLAKHNFEFFL